MSATATEFDKAAFQATLKRYMRFQQRIEEAKEMKEPRLVQMVTAGYNLCGHRIMEILTSHPDEARAAADEIGLEIA